MMMMNNVMISMCYHICNVTVYQITLAQCVCITMHCMAFDGARGLYARRRPVLSGDVFGCCGRQVERGRLDCGLCDRRFGRCVFAGS
jgi:hypothetical protein